MKLYSYRCLSVRQPWAAAIFQLGKDVENRTWNTNYRGVLAIHAGLTICDDVDSVRLSKQLKVLARGAVIGTVELVDCIETSDSPWAQPGQYHWVLRNPKPLPAPWTCRGKTGLFSVDVPYPR